MKKKKTKNFKKRILFCVLFAFLFAGIFFFKKQIYSFVNNEPFGLYETIRENDLVVHYIDVGQGDAIAIKFPDDKTMLIDCGPKSSEDNLITYLNNNFFLDEEEKTFDYFVITHAHEDHIGGGVEIFENYQVNHFYRPSLYTQDEIDFYEEEYGAVYASTLHLQNTIVFKNLIEKSVDEENCETIFVTPNIIPLSILGENYLMKFFTPFLYDYSNINNFSPIMLLQYMGKNLMFTGDAETEIENEYLSLNLDIKVDVLKVGHHGSSTSSSENFLNSIMSTYAIISVGKDNSYNHPNTNVLERFAEINTTLYRTDINGTILVGINGQTINIALYNTTNFPVKIEVWEIYIAICVLVCYTLLTFNFVKKTKN